MQAILFVMIFISILAIQSFGELKIALEDRLFEKWEKKEETLRYRVRLAFAESELERYKADHPIERESRPRAPKGLDNPKAKKERPKKSTPLNFDETRPPENSRLNLWECISEKKEPYYEGMARLMRGLYGHKPFFMERAGFEYQILEELSRKKEEIATLNSVDELASLVLKNESLQEVFYKILRGGADFPSLLWYVRLDQKRGSLNMLFAPLEVLISLFGKEFAFDFDALRSGLLIRMRDEEENRSLLEADLCLNRTAIHQQLKVEGEALLIKYKIVDDSKCFDFHLGKPGSILYLVDDLTGAKVRERLATNKT